MRGPQASAGCEAHARPGQDASLGLGLGLLLAVPLGRSGLLPLLQGLLVLGLQRRRLLLVGGLRARRQGLPLLARELAHHRPHGATGLLLEGLAVVAEPEPVGVLRPGGRARVLPRLLPCLLVRPGLLGLRLVRPPLTLHATRCDELLHLLLVRSLGRLRLLVEGGLL